MLSVTVKTTGNSGLRRRVAEVLMASAVIGLGPARSALGHRRPELAATLVNLGVLAAARGHDEAAPRTLRASHRTAGS